MSRIGKQPIAVPEGVEITVEPELVRVKGPKGELAERVSRDIGVEQQNGELLVTRPSDRGEHRALHGLTRSLIFNMVEGVTNGYEKRLEIQGVGYRAQLQGRMLVLALGYSHPVELEAPEGIDFEVPVPTRIVVRGISKQAVGEVAARIRKVRPPEPYKGKGIRYQGEYVARKVGKRALVSRPSRNRAFAGAAACAPRSAAPPSARGSRYSARTAACRPRSSTTCAAIRSPPSTGPKRSSKTFRAWTRPSAPASCSPSGPSRRVSRPASSTAAATAFTARSRRWPTAPAKAA